MASTYSNLKIQLMATGENSTTWGAVTNTNLGTAIEEAISGSADVTFASNNQTLTLTNTNATQTARNMRLNLTGTTGGSTRTLTVPDIEKMYVVNNGCADAVQVKNSTGANVSVPAGTSTIVFSTGTGVVAATSNLPSLTLGTPLAVSSGGTGSNTATFSGANITSLNANNISSGVLAVAQGGTGSATATFSGANITSLNANNISSGILAIAQGGTGLTSPGTSGNVLTSSGGVWASVALPAPPSYGTMANQNANNVNITGGSITGITDLAVADGGTGASTFAANNVLLGNGASSFQTVAPGTSGNVLTSNGTTWASAALTAPSAVTQTEYAFNTTHSVNVSGPRPILLTMMFAGGQGGASNVYLQFQWGLGSLTDSRVIADASVNYQIAFTPTLIAFLTPVGSTTLQFRCNQTNLGGGYGAPSTFRVVAVQL